MVSGSGSGVVPETTAEHEGEQDSVDDQYEPGDRDHDDLEAILPVEPDERPHQELMDDMAGRAYAYVKTGECTAHASVVLVCGVNYLEEAIDRYTSLHGEPPA